MHHFEDEIRDIFTFKADSCDRLDVFLSKKIDRSRTFCADLISSKFVLVNGKFQKSSYKTKLNDQVDVQIPVEKIPDISPKEIDFEVIDETENFAIINKPPFLTVHPAPGNFDNTLVNGLMYKFNIQDNDNDFRPGIVHRLDKDTSGIMLIAKHQKARELYSNLFKDRLIEKEYLAICVGNPSWEEKLIESNIARHKTNRQKMCSTENGRYAKTKVNVLWRDNDIFFAKIKIFTGRTHQIRVHMSDLGYPLLGDSLYGNKLSLKFNFKRQALHSYSLKFLDPFNDDLCEYFANLYSDMKEFLEKRGCIYKL